MRLRITFAKQGAQRYIGHLDLQQVWERTIRRAGLPLAYTQGFHPGPKMQIAAALPLGFIGLAEKIDIWLLDEGIALEGLAERLQAAAPPGLQGMQVETVDAHAPALQTQVIAAVYAVELLEDAGDIGARVASLLAAGNLPRQRRGKAYDLRPLIERLEVAPGRLQMQLAARPGATGRPEEVLAELGIAPEAARITRTCIVFQDDVKSIIPEQGG